MRKSNKGMTMVEVIVAFAILMIGLAGLYKATVFSGNQLNKAKEIYRQVDGLMEGYYTQNTALAQPDSGRDVKASFVLEGFENAGATPEVLLRLTDYKNDQAYHMYVIEPPIIPEGGD